MIKAILIFNNHGKPRLSKFYQRYVRGVLLPPLFLVAVLSVPGPCCGKLLQLLSVARTVHKTYPAAEKQALPGGKGDRERWWC
uniref:AP complex mu/sigma subunit domain-containing protein n=1 Tax=Pelusios castaneus TaxID=367368 RepID=A0A8C8VDW8_9SAUR